MERYNRNRIYISKEEQILIRNKRILLGGAGVGSIIAECALRFGFEDIVIVDGDKVELTNLNRQNYVNGDIGKYKAECLARRLNEINPEANIRFHTAYIDNNNIDEYLEGIDIAINALDFNSELPFIFDEQCSQKGIPVLHPYNLGWGALLSIVSPGGCQLREISNEWKNFEVKMAEYVTNYFTVCNIPNRWLNDVIESYTNEAELMAPPQLSIASWIVAGQCVNAMFDIITGKEVKYFPKFYFTSIKEGIK